jgi:hypothetical protein
LTISAYVIGKHSVKQVNISEPLSGYNLKYLGKIGNVFHTKDIEAAIDKGRKYDPDDLNQSYFTSKSMGIDPAYGISAFGIVVLR